MPASYQIGPATFVTLDYTVFDAEGDPVPSGANQLGFVFGHGQLLPAIERALDGRITGDRCSVELAPRDAYGERDPRAILAVDRAEFPDGVQPGDRFEMENASGALLVAQVLEVTSEAVQLDLNHPLAGQEIRVELSVREVRPATEPEIESALRALEAETVAENPSTEGELDGSRRLIPLDRLLRGPAQGYEKAPAGERSGMERSSPLDPWRDR